MGGITLKLGIISFLSLVLYQSVAESGASENCAAHTDDAITNHCKLTSKDRYDLFGPTGFRGDKGSTGPKGDTGQTGYRGSKGFKGEKGNPKNGPKGMPGDNGESGGTGPPGMPGLPGICGCVHRVRYEDQPEGEIKTTFGGPEEDPGTDVCKSPTANLSTSTPILQSLHLDFPVVCNFTSGDTCVSRKIEMSKNYTVRYPTENQRGSFWLSEKINKNVLQAINNKDTEYEQIMWLQKRSETVRQRLRYYCKNSVPYSKENISSSVLLMTWNNDVIGPEPTDSTPFFYRVPPETDHCKKGSNNWQSTDIVLETDHVSRLPIIDVLIRDIDNGNQTQEFHVQTIDLCFN